MKIEGKGLVVVQAPPARSGGEGLRRVGGKEAGPHRALASHKLEPARTCKHKRVKKARAVAKGAGATSDACSSGPPPWGSKGGDGRAIGARVRPGPAACLLALAKNNTFR